MSFLLTIAIPTWNRASYLKPNIEQLQAEISQCDEGMVELLISDNHSEDETESVVRDAQARGVAINYIRNHENIGSDRNIAQCFNRAQGDYVWILGDDDFLLDGCLSYLLSHLKGHQLGAICLKAYGFEQDFRKEQPGEGGKERFFDNAGDFLKTIGAAMSLISSCIIQKKAIADIDANDYLGSNLVQVNLVLRAALAKGDNLYLDKYLVGCKRNNSGGYDFAKVFVTNFNQVLNDARPYGLSEQAIKAIGRNLLLTYYPFYLLRQRLSEQGMSSGTRERFIEYYSDTGLFKYWNDPIMTLPKPLAIAWGSMTTVVGRAAKGDVKRGIYYVFNRAFKK